MPRLAKFKPESVQVLLHNAIQVELTKILPEILQTAGIPPGLIQPYMPTLLPAISQKLSLHLAQGFHVQGLVLGAIDNGLAAKQLLQANPQLFNGFMAQKSGGAVAAVGPSLPSNGTAGQAGSVGVSPGNPSTLAGPAIIPDTPTLDNSGEVTG